MKRLAVLIGCAALALAGEAAAKGPDRATISGPGLDKPVVLKGDSESASQAASPFFRFVQDVGFFPAVFPQTPNPMLPGRPKGLLGPRYSIVYRVPGPDRNFFRMTQDLYPYAAGGPVTYMPAGQSIFGMKTFGGWYQAALDARARIVSLGLPARAPGSRGLSGGAWAGIGVGGLIALAAGTLGVRRRMR
jgi:hypothetical protein